MILGEKAGYVLVDIRRNALVESLFDAHGVPMGEEALVARALSILNERERKAEGEGVREQLDKLCARGLVETKKHKGRTAYRLTSDGAEAAQFLYVDILGDWPNATASGKPATSE